MQTASSTTAPTRLIIVDSDTDFLGWASSHLKAQNVTIECFEKADEALSAYLKNRADLVLAEARLPGINGIELLKRLRQQDPNAMVLLFSGIAGNSVIIEAMRFGAYDFLRKEQMPYDLRSVVENALSAVEARRTTLANLAPVSNADSIQETIIGRSPAMQDVFKMIGRVSRSDAAVMVTGESGCGKELVARAIHKFSPRTQKEFVAINITAIPDNLLESELFGHEKGAFTGAVSQRMGRFEQCDGGTLFLDEIGDMPLAVQSKLLRVLQEGEFSRVGGNDTIRTDVRVLAATNKDLEKEVNEGRFREDLFYRLHVVRIHLPPLRERRDDIRILAEFFLQKMAMRKRTPQMRFSEDALSMMEAYDWPGNVRELENTILRACALCNTDVLLPNDVPLGSSTQRAASSNPITTLMRMQDAVEMLLQCAMAVPDFELLPWLDRELKKSVLRHTEQDAEKASRILGVPVISNKPDVGAQAADRSAKVTPPVKVSEPKVAKARKVS